MTRIEVTVAVAGRCREAKRAFVCACIGAVVAVGCGGGEAERARERPIATAVVPAGTGDGVPAPTPEADDPRAGRAAPGVLIDGYVEAFSPPGDEAEAPFGLGAAGEATCALARNGAVYCWGTFAAPRLDGEEGGVSDRGTEASAERFMLADGATQLSVSADQACAVVNDGHVRCLGIYGTYDVDGIDDASVVTAGIGRGCVLRDGGRLFCWRAPRRVERPASAPATAVVATAVEDVGPAVALSGFGDTFCARDRQRRAYCWGPGGADDWLNAIRVARLRRVEETVVGARHVCARLTGGRLACASLLGSRVRDAEFGAVAGIDADDTGGAAAGDAQPAPGDGPASAGMPAPFDVGPSFEVAGLVDVLSMAVGDQHACARVAGGQVRCFALADGAAARDVPELVGTDELWGSDDYFCARTGGHLSCWGADRACGELAAFTLEPRMMVGLAGVVSVAPGTSHACALRADGQVACWGDNRRAQLAGPAAIERRCPNDL